MSKIRTILVDDEKGSREVLSDLISRNFNEIEIVGQAANVDEAFSLINTQKPHLVFLDIQMPKASGFDLLKKFDDVQFEIVFVTSFDKYAINAIKFSALDYLLKPVVTEDLRIAIEKVIRAIRLKSNTGQQVINLLHSMNTDSSGRRIAVHAGENVRFLNETEIVHVEGDGRYSRITMVNGEKFTTAKNLKEFEEYFEVTNSFVRVSKDMLVNTRHIKQYSKGDPCVIELINGQHVEVSRRRKTEVIGKLKKS